MYPFHRSIQSLNREISVPRPSLKGVQRVKNSSQRVLALRNKLVSLRKLVTVGISKQIFATMELTSSVSEVSQRMPTVLSPRELRISALSHVRLGLYAHLTLLQLSKPAILVDTASMALKTLIWSFQGLEEMLFLLVQEE